MNSLLKSKGNRPRTGGIKTCIQCGKIVYRRPSELNKQHCSYKCYLEYKKTHNALLKKGCKQCGQPYEVYRSQARHYGSSFCSWACSKRYSQEQAAKPVARSKRRQMRSGKMRSLDNIFSKIIRARDKCCQRCGTTRTLQCSHVVPRTFIGTRWNLDNAITLCYACHLHWWHKYPHEATEWFDSKWPGRAVAMREIANQHVKINREEVYERLSRIRLDTFA